MSELEFGAHMRRESAQSAAVLHQGLGAILPQTPAKPQAIYTIARGSSDAAATILNYEFMRVLGVPATSLPPSVFSVGTGIEMTDDLVVTLSQSGASLDLVAATAGAAATGATTIAITNVDGSPVEGAATMRIPIDAGPELAVPATKSVVGAVAAGVALIGAIDPAYRAQIAGLVADNSPADFQNAHLSHDVVQPLVEAQHIFVVGRQAMFGAAQEIALKIKECCAIHAESYSASEVLHGPMQLANNGLLTLLLDDRSPELAAGLDLAEQKLRAAGSTVIRVTLEVAETAPQAVKAALFLVHFYPQILQATLALGINPDAPSSLAKVTETV